MSNRDYIAWSLLSAGVIALIGSAVRLLGEKYGWIRNPTYPSGLNRPAIFKMLDAGLTITATMYLGFTAMYWLSQPLSGSEAPDWTDTLLLAWAPIAGGQHVIDSFGKAERRVADRVIGGILLVGGIFLVASSFLHPSAKA